MHGNEKMVTHPADGIYLSKFMAGVLATVMAASMVGAFGNLWYLNRKAIEFQAHVDEVSKADVISRTEFESQKQVWQLQLQNINQKLDALAKSLKEQDRR